MLNVLRVLVSERSAGLVFLALCSNMREGGTVRITQAAIAHECDLKLRQVSEELTYLADGNWIELVELSREPGGSLVCNIGSSFLKLM